MERRENVIFNDATQHILFLRLYDVRHMVQNKHEIHCRYNMGYSFRLVSSHTQYCTYPSLCYTSRGALTGTRKSSVDPPWEIDPTTHRTMNGRSTTELNLAPLATVQFKKTNKKNKNNIVHTQAFVILVGEHWLEREKAQWIHWRRKRGGGGGKGACAPHFFAWGGGAMVCLCPPHF